MAVVGSYIPYGGLLHSALVCGTIIQKAQQPPIIMAITSGLIVFYWHSSRSQCISPLYKGYFNKKLCQYPLCSNFTLSTETQTQKLHLLLKLETPSKRGVFVSLIYASPKRNSPRNIHEIKVFTTKEILLRLCGPSVPV